MIERLAWPSHQDNIVDITFELMAGFDIDGNPIYKSGRIGSKEALEEVQGILEPLFPEPLSITSVTMGKVQLKLQSGASIIIRPVFHPSRNMYQDVFKVDHLQYTMPQSFADVLALWRERD